MKLFILSFFIFFLFSTSTSLVAQNTPQWQYYGSGAGINAIAEEGNYLWLGTSGAGLVKFEKSNGE